MRGICNGEVAFAFPPGLPRSSARPAGVLCRFPVGLSGSMFPPNDPTSPVLAPPKHKRTGLFQFSSEQRVVQPDMQPSRCEQAARCSGAIA
jgi:hypothetical protein